MKPPCTPTCERRTFDCHMEGKCEAWGQYLIDREAEKKLVKKRKSYYQSEATQLIASVRRSKKMRS